MVVIFPLKQALLAIDPIPILAYRKSILRIRKLVASRYVAIGNPELVSLNTMALAFGWF
jgi:hypothetical protein